MQIERCSLFENEFDYKITKPIRMIELFAGVGSQFKSLKNLNANVESYKICEWAVNSIIGYNAIHNGQTKAQNKLDSEFLANELFKMGVSIDYSDPATLKQLKNIKNEKLNLIYESIKNTHNLVNIMQVKGGDLEIKETDKYEYILTYSFPCQ